MTLDVDNARRWLVENHPHEECRHLAELLRDYSLFVLRKPCDHHQGRSWTSVPGCDYEICGTCCLTRPLRSFSAAEAVDKIADILERTNAD